ncbi:anthocyanidin 3-O-glucoside 6''-O-acyltransferase-like [Salvia miltiorrhiza]|uniref:anthocyanidin 3-O-glucoside 6''-O-acyltransferase-like n=1 Tax=Salvia miltiorrhiza TaxID=226208 RepID=UPI0025AC97F1|nr:anthocyanidin 3-O-glucoside 6''-O-acyltransferase-like [Salvia miltiorrhiza]
MTTTVLESCGVAPPPGLVADQSLPLTFFDINWLHFHPMLQLLFYEFPCSKPHFLETIVPKLKQSLSLSLKHFFPLSGHVVYPSSPEEMPIFQYLSGDSVPVTVAESSDDFDDLVGDRAQSADKLYSFIPRLPPIVEESDRKLLKVLAVQATLFPGRGVCIGITTHHCVSDAPSFLGFLTSWSAISRGDGDEEFVSKHGELLPVFDRSLINYPLKLDAIYWKNAQRIPLQSRHPSLPTNRVRSTYTFTQSEIKKLKNSIQERIPNLAHLSSFVAIAAYIWTIMAKSLRSEADNDGDGDAFFLIPIDLRPRLDPAVPGNYFGNCLSFALPRMGRRELAGEEGLFLAAEAAAAAIEERTGDKKILESVEKWSGEIRQALQESFFSVAGSTRLDLYGADFGWGRARKQEILSIDGEKYAMTLCKSRDFVGGFEVCLSLPKDKMEAFHAYFAKGIN